jgi:hypothetical protein
MSDDLDNLNLAQIKRLLRAKAGTPQRLNAATQTAIDATLAYGNLRPGAANEETLPEDFNNYFKFGGD